MRNQSGQDILVVGGACGIGRIVAEMLIVEDERPLVVDRDEVALNKRKDEWGEKGQALRMDLTNREEVAHALTWVKSQAGMLDIVVITAAIHSTYPVEYLPDEVLDRVLDVNLVSHIRFVRDIIPMIRQGGRIITVSSVSAGVGIPMESIYSASKAGLELFYECLSIELSYKDIRCVIIQPGNVNTGFNEKGNDYRPVGNRFIDGLYKKVVERTNSRYGIPPEQVARAIMKSIRDRNPSLCVLVGGNAIKAHWAKRLLGRDRALKLIKKMMVS
jgi:NAD(P)-dependent dehydrogenase (short-subunit alcohol dehydrogenase family)